jgi:hypothetical protein
MVKQDDISVALPNAPKMTKKGRAAARRRMRKRRSMDPSMNNPNDIGAKIIPVGTPSSL